ncbi:MAG TPA: right-handed parallel beta-helix repeat-containing protein [Gemmatimonadaceae bacterium]|jgi:nitrous oxidase accessory protein NosD
MRRILLVLLFGAIVKPVHGQVSTIPRAGLVISRTTAIRPGFYQLTAPATLDSALIVIRGSNITVDFAGVRLIGTPSSADPDRAVGVAIMVDGGANVTIKNAHIRGYKVAILARGTRNLRLIDNDLSFNWKPRLYSIVEHESLADWLSYHHNEKDEWLRYGAAIYLSGVRGGEVRGNTVVQGMNGLLMTATDSLLAWNNDFSFNSGLGIGMYRSSHNRVMHNRVEFNVRGYSEGFYRRGQDSAGILIYEQSDSNTVAFNAVTHGGDGLFLWAGQHTMDTGEGGANDNVIYGNDFSWAPANGIEATFSRNVFIKNVVRGSDYGVWGGYSFNSVVLANELVANRVGIAIEHGQENRILANHFDRDSTAVHLWANPIEPSEWGYPKHRDTRSRGYDSRWNSISGSRVAYRVAQTEGLDGRGNLIHADTLLVARDTASVKIDTAISVVENFVADLHRQYEVRPLPGARRTLPGVHADWPRSTIVVDEWGPYDWTSPKLWPADSSLTTPLKLRVLGPKGIMWSLVSSRGTTLSKTRGHVGDTIVVTPVLPNAGHVENWTVTLRSGPRTFSYSRFDPRASWNVTVFAWTDSTHPLNASPAFAALLRGERGGPALSLTTSRLDYVWSRPRVPGWPRERAGVVAVTSVDLPSGEYALRTISDDGIRVFVDDRMAIEDWSVHESVVHEVPMAAGRHRIRVEYFQLDGWTELRAEIVKGRQ